MDNSPVGVERHEFNRFGIYVLLLLPFVLVVNAILSVAEYCFSREVNVAIASSMLVLFPTGLVKLWKLAKQIYNDEV